jgi:hypothetical protein
MSEAGEDGEAELAEYQVFYYLLAKAPSNHPVAVSSFI